LGAAPQLLTSHCLPACHERRPGIFHAKIVCTQERPQVRTSIVLDEELVAEAMRRTGIKTKRAVVKEAPGTLIQLKRQEEILALRGKLGCEGDLDRMRRA
jgi:Arc/MetJ family transcription regulator